MRMCLLDGDGALVGKLGKVWLQRQVIVNRLDIDRQHLTALGDVNGRVALGAKVLAHVSSMGTVPHSDKGRVSGGWRGAERWCRRGSGVTREASV
jgi:hypothetical protein